MSDEDPDVDELFEEADEQARTDVSANAVGDETDVVNAIADAYDQLRNGDTSTTLTLRDERIAAIIRGLDKSGQLSEISQSAWNSARGEPSGQIESRSGALAGLLRAGLESVDESIFDTDQEAFDQYREEHETQKR